MASRRCEKKNEYLEFFQIFTLIFSRRSLLPSGKSGEPFEKRRHMINIYGGKARRQEAILEKREKDGIFLQEKREDGNLL